VKLILNFLANYDVFDDNFDDVGMFY